MLNLQLLFKTLGYIKYYLITSAYLLLVASATIVIRFRLKPPSSECEGAFVVYGLSIK
jgi:hypothetical protein